MLVVWLYPVRLGCGWPVHRLLCQSLLDTLFCIVGCVGEVFGENERLKLLEGENVLKVMYE